MRNKKRIHLLLLMLMLLCFQLQPNAQDESTYTEIPVGVILNMRSWVGKTVHSCITIALSEFYKVNNHYQTRIVVHNRDTQGETLHALRTGKSYTHGYNISVCMHLGIDTVLKPCEILHLHVAWLTCTGQAILHHRSLWFAFHF